MKITHTTSGRHLQSQIEKYGSYEAYKAEMKRRRALYTPKSKLSKEQLREFLSQGLSQKEIATLSGLTQPQISYLVNKKYRLFDEKQ